MAKNNKLDTRRTGVQNDRLCSVKLNLNCRLGANAPDGIPTKLPSLSTNSLPGSLRTCFNDRLTKLRVSLAAESKSAVTKLVAGESNYAPKEDLNEPLLEDLISSFMSFTMAGCSSIFKNEPYFEKSTLTQNLCSSSEAMSLGLVHEEHRTEKCIGKKEESCSLNKSSVSHSEGDFPVSNSTRSECFAESSVLEDEALAINPSSSDANGVASPWCTPVLENEYGAISGIDSYPLYQTKRKVQRELESTPKLSRYDFPTSFASKERRSQHEDIHEEVERIFSKRFSFEKTGSWQLPDPSVIFSAELWEVNELVECKNKLNAVKEKLDDLDLSMWHAHTNRRNRAGCIIRKVRKEINPEFPTQAWCKFYENVSSFKLVPEKAEQEKKLRSVHLCEAPGAFITSLNHYLKSKFDSDFDWDWLATTLNPHYEGNPLSLMINEDRLILHTMDHWVFGKDQTGDLMCPENVYFLLDNIKDRLGDVLLVTADGSIDCQTDPGEQEKHVAWLHFCETITAMQILAKGGSFLLKIFTIFECSTACLVYFLCCAFESVTVNKPATSKEGNSETYVVCENYVGRDQMQPWLSILAKSLSPLRVRKAIFPLDLIPSDFIKAVIECANLFRIFQSDVIEANLQSFRDPSQSEQSRINRIRGLVTDEFFYRYQLKKLPEHLDVVGRQIINRSEAFNLDPRTEVGTFSDKKKRSTLPKQEEILHLKEDAVRISISSSWSLVSGVCWYQFKSEGSEDTFSQDIKLFKGKAVKCINSSKFCLGSLLDIRNKVREIVFGSRKSDQVSVSGSIWRERVGFPEVEGQSFVLDFKNQLWASSDAGKNAVEEDRAFRRIINEFDNLMRDDNLIIKGYPLLTQFNVGLVYLLGHCFKRVGLTRPEGQNVAIIFEKHIVNNSKYKVKETLDEIGDNLRPYGNTVLAMLPIQKLCGSDFYKYVTLINNLCVKEQILELIAEYSKRAEEKSERPARRFIASDVVRKL